MVWAWNDPIDETTDLYATDFLLKFVAAISERWMGIDYGAPSSGTWRFPSQHYHAQGPDPPAGTDIGPADLNLTPNPGYTPPGTPMLAPLNYLRAEYIAQIQYWVYYCSDFGRYVPPDLDLTTVAVDYNINTYTTPWTQICYEGINVFSNAVGHARRSIFTDLGLPGVGPIGFSDPYTPTGDWYYGPGTTLHFNNGFTRKYPREITSTTAAGTAGQKARLLGYTPHAGQVHVHDGTTWVPSSNPYGDTPDILVGHGQARTGDYYGPWLFEELRAAINLLTRTIYGAPLARSLSITYTQTSKSYGSAVVDDADNYILDWSAACARAQAQADAGAEVTVIDESVGATLIPGLEWWGGWWYGTSVKQFLGQWVTSPDHYVIYIVESTMTDLTLINLPTNINKIVDIYTMDRTPDLAWVYVDAGDDLTPNSYKLHASINAGMDGTVVVPPWAAATPPPPSADPYLPEVPYNNGPNTGSVGQIVVLISWEFQYHA